MSAPKKASERILRLQRDLSLRLYKSILRSHRALPEEMRAVGDVYVREEFKQHKSAKPEHLGPFFEQWLQYLNHLRQMSPEDPTSVGRDLPKTEIDALSDDQQEKLINMFNETQRLFSGNYTPADVGIAADGADSPPGADEGAAAAAFQVHQVRIVREDGPSSGSGAV